MLKPAKYPDENYMTITDVYIGVYSMLMWYVQTNIQLKLNEYD